MGGGVRHFRWGGGFQYFGRAGFSSYPPCTSLDMKWHFKDIIKKQLEILDILVNTIFVFRTINLVGIDIHIVIFKMINFRHILLKSSIDRIAVRRSAFLFFMAMLISTISLYRFWLVSSFVKTRLLSRISFYDINAMRRWEPIRNTWGFCYSDLKLNII